MRVLIIEDEAAICQLVRDHLELQGVGTVSAGSVAAGRAALAQEDFHVVILDLTLPDGSGLEVLADLRSTGSDAHVIVLTGAGSEADRINAFESGADDYVVKPFFARELAARVLAVERRRNLTEDTTLRIGPLEIDLNAREVTADGQPIDLTTKEFALLAFLAARPGHTFSRDELLRAVWQSSPDWQQIATVTEHMRRLRSKIESDPRHPTMLKTVRGVGYRIDAPSPERRGADQHEQQSLVAGFVTGAHGDLSDAVIVTDLHFHVRSWNGAAERLYGWREHEALGRHLLDVVDWENDELSGAVRNLETTGHWSAQGRQHTRDGSLIDVVSSMTMMRDVSGEVAGVVSVNRPVLVPLDQPTEPVGSGD